MDINMDQLRNLYNPEQSFMGQVQKQDAASAAQEQMLAQAAQMRQSAAKSAALLPMEVNKANYENSDAVRGADMRSKNAVAGYNEANTAVVWNKLDATKQQQIVQGVMDGHMNIAKQGEIIASQGGNGQVAYDQLKQMLTQQLQQADNPKQKQQAQKALADLEQQAQLTGMTTWDSNRLLIESKKMQKILSDQDPTIIMEKLKGDNKMKEIGAQGANQIAVANIGAASREGVAASKGEKMPTTGIGLIARDLRKLLDDGKITEDVYHEKMAAAYAAGQNPNRIPGSTFVAGDDGKMKMKPVEKVPAYTPPNITSTGKTVVATGTNKAGKKVVKYSDGSIEEAK